MILNRESGCPQVREASSFRSTGKTMGFPVNLTCMQMFMHSHAPQLTCVLKIGEGLISLADHKGVAINEDQGLLPEILPVHASIACRDRDGFDVMNFTNPLGAKSEAQRVNSGTGI